MCNTATPQGTDDQQVLQAVCLVRENSYFVYRLQVQCSFFINQKREGEIQDFLSPLSKRVKPTPLNYIFFLDFSQPLPHEFNPASSEEGVEGRGLEGGG